MLKNDEIRVRHILDAAREVEGKGQVLQSYIQFLGIQIIKICYEIPYKTNVLLQDLTPIF
jgi:hypothetical protein